MIDKRLLTAEEFSDQLFDLPEGGRWHELHSGHIVMLEPPTDVHGNVVLNLSKAYAAWAGQTQARHGYAVFDLSLIVRRAPDSVFSPAMSFFTEGSRFAETDKVISDTKPRLVCEIASTNDRRSGIRKRVEAYHHWGVDCVWVVDPIECVTNVIPRGKMPTIYSKNETLEHQELLTGFEIPVEDLFKNPSWWDGPS